MGQWDNETRRKTSCPIVPLSHCPIVPPFLWHFPSPRVTRFNLEGKLRPDLNHAWRERRGEAAKLACLVLQFASEANTLLPQLIEAERAVGDIVHVLEVEMVE